MSRGGVGQGLGAIADSALLRYLFVGGIAAFADWAIFAFFAIGLSLDYIPIAVIGFLVATLINYSLSIRFVFVGGRHAQRVEVSLVFLVSAFGLLLNVAALFALMKLLLMHPMLAKVLATAAVFAWNFGARKFWVFAGFR